MSINTFTLIYYRPNKSVYERCGRQDQHVSNSNFEIYVYQNDADNIKYLVDQWATLMFNDNQDPDYEEAEITLLMDGLDKNNWEDEYNIPEQQRSAYIHTFAMLKQAVDHRYGELLTAVRKREEERLAKIEAAKQEQARINREKAEAAERAQYEELKKKFEPVDCNNCWKCLDGKYEEGSSFPIISTRMILCPTCGNKRCPKASDHTLQCTNSNEPGQKGSVY